MRRRQKAMMCAMGAALLLSVLLNAWLWRHGGEGRTEVRTDTTRVTYTDTVVYHKPVARESVVVRYAVARLAVAEDTAQGHIAEAGGKAQDHFADVNKMVDSVRVEIPITQKRYADSTYTAWVSGWEPRLDSIMVYPRREVIRITRDRTTKARTGRWGVGVEAGYGWGPKGWGPHVGVGISYSIFRF